jgi:uncharacterized membrane protein YgcG
MTMRYIATTALVMLVWFILALQFASDSDPVDRTMFVAVGIVIAGLAILASRRPPLTGSRNDLGGGDGIPSDYESDSSSHHGGGDGGGHDGGGGDGGH